MLSRVLRRLLLPCAIIALFLCIAPKLAHAQAAITIYQETSLPRVKIDANGNKVDVKKRAINLTPEGVSNQDCIDNVQIRFPIQLAGFEGNGTLEAWAGLSGESCSSNTVRTSASRTCWKLVSGIPLTINQNVDIPVRTIMSGIKAATTPNDSASICGTIDLTTVSVNFLYFSPGQTNDASSTKTVSVQVDTVGPSAPTGLKALPGNDRLVMQWNSISGEGGVSVLTGIRVYCDATHSTGIPNVPECQDLIKERAAAAGTTASTTDSGTDSGTTAAILPDGGCIEDVDDAGNTIAGSCADAGTSSSSSSSSSGTTTTGAAAGDGGLGTEGACDSANLAPTDGTTVSPTEAFNKCFSCGTITGNTGTSVAASSLRGAPLVNGTHYAISVAATDAFNNVGPLSTPQCDYPEETNDFWKDYKNDGGNAGGGCNTTGDAPLGSLAFIGGSLALVISTLRRRSTHKKVGR